MNFDSKIIHAIGQLRLWKKLANHPIVFLAQTLADPIFVVALPEASHPRGLLGHYLFFRGLKAFQQWCGFQRIQDFSVIQSPMDIEHEEIISYADRSVFLSFKPGFVPLELNAQSTHPNAVIPLLYQTLLPEFLGTLMRLESDSVVLKQYATRETSFFTRAEALDGVWHDSDYTLSSRTATWVEEIEMKKDMVEKAAKLPQREKEMWEYDFVLVPNLYTKEPCSRLVFQYSAVRKSTRGVLLAKPSVSRRILWKKISVGETGLNGLWGQAAAQILERIVKLGYIPGAIHIRSNRLMRFLRPLGMAVPVKLVLHNALPELEAALKAAWPQKG